MGQYYIFVNLDKKEFIAPRDFGDYNKLLEFGGSRYGALCALSILTAEGVGRGGGDAYREAYEEQGKLFEPQPGEKIESERTVTRNKHHQRLPGNKKQRYRTMIPDFTGRWAGDRIVTAGDYMDYGKYLSLAEQLSGALRNVEEAYLNYKYQWEQDYEQRPSQRYKLGPLMRQDEWLKSEKGAHNWEVNLYFVATHYYKNIGRDAYRSLRRFNIGEMTCDEDVHELICETLEKRLRTDYQPGVLHTVGKGRSARQRWDLSWVDRQTLDSILIRWDSREQFTRVKRWLLKQQLLPWQATVINMYKFSDRPSMSDMAKALRAKGIDHSPVMDVEKPELLLPARPFLQAALNVQAQVSNEPNGVIKAPPVGSTEALVVEAAKIQVREDRVITLDK